MSLKGYLAKLGFTTAAAGSAAVLAFSAGSDLDASSRTGWYADIATSGSEHLGLVAGGVESARALTTGFDVFGELHATTANGGQLWLRDSGLLYEPDAVGQNFRINRIGHSIESTTSGNNSWWTFSRTAVMRVGVTSDSTNRGLLSMQTNDPIHVSIDGTTVGRFLKDSLSVDVATPSTSTTTGALVVAGGVGIGGSFYAPLGDTVFKLGTGSGTSDNHLTVFQSGNICLLRGHFRDRFDSSDTVGAVVSHGASGGGGGGSGGSSRTALRAYVTDANQSVWKWVTAIGIEGFVVGSAAGDNRSNIGVLGRGTTTGTDNDTSRAIGILGRGEATGTLRRNYGGRFEALTAAGTNYGIYATASGAVNNYAGYFDGHTYVDGNLTVTGIAATGKISTSSTAADSIETAGGIEATALTVPRGVVTSQGFGAGALSSNTTGTNNTASGYQALFSNTTGEHNTASGYRALYGNTTGEHNTASGYLALYSNTTGIRNTASGYRALLFNTTGNYNTASGYESLLGNTTGNNNTASGYWAGRYINAGTAATDIDNCVLLGYDTRVSAATDTNEIVIGAEARGNGSNTATIGNSSITATHLRNAVITGTTPASVASGEVKIGGGAVLVAGDVDIGGTTDSTSTTTGALVVGGGVGIGGSVHIGGGLNLPSLFGQGVLYMDEGVVSAIGILPGLLYTQLVTASGATTDAPTLSGLNLNAQVSGLIDPPYSADSPILSIKGRFDDGFFDGTPGVEIGVELPTGDSQFSLVVRNAEDADDIILIEYQSGAYTTALAGDLRVGTNIEINQAGWAYYGSPSANGSWRFGRDGDNTVFQRRESDTWVTKMTVEA